jgi:hypothetical protein
MCSGKMKTEESRSCPGCSTERTRISSETHLAAFTSGSGTQRRLASWALAVVVEDKGEVVVAVFGMGGTSGVVGAFFSTSEDTKLKGEGKARTW